MATQLFDIVNPDRHIFVFHCGKMYDGQIETPKNISHPRIEVKQLGVTFDLPWHQLNRALVTDECVVL